MNSYKRVLTVQDISCFGQCSLTVALPILSACGSETVILPSAVLSTHTAGFSGFTVRDLTEDIPGIAAHWKKENISFDCIYTGYLGSTKQIGYVAEIMDTLLRDKALKIVDPAMADNGKLYPAFDMTYVNEMKKLCAKADILLPNITEASFLTGVEFCESYDEKYIERIMKALLSLGCKTVVLTGVGFKEGKTGVAVSNSDGSFKYYEHEKIEKGSHGTGDVYASAFTGAIMQGKSEFESAKIAADYTLQCIKNTQGDSSHFYGVKFETCLDSLIEMIGK